MNNASSHTPIIPSSGIVWREDFQDPVSIRKNGGVINGTVPIKGKSAVFNNNASNYIEYPRLKCEGWNGITLACWIDKFTLGASWRTLVCQFGAGGFQEFMLDIINTGRPRAYVVFAGAGAQQPTGGSAPSDWMVPHHFAMTWQSGERLKIFMDGVRQSQTALMSPVIWTESTHQVLLFKDDAGGQQIILRYTSGNVLRLFIDNGGGSTESLVTSIAQANETQNRNVLLTFKRSNDVQEIWIDSALVASGTDTSVDASGTGDVYIGSNDTPSQYIRNNCGISFFGYVQRTLTQTQISHYAEELRNLM